MRPQQEFSFSESEWIYSVQGEGSATDIKLFCSYSHRDEHLRDELAKHLKLLERQGLVRTWHDRQIGAGDLWKQAIDKNLEEADIILLLISADFLASDYCFDIEMKIALERHAAGKALVVPVILRPVDWQTTPFRMLQALPKMASRSQHSKTSILRSNRLPRGSAPQSKSCVSLTTGKSHGLQRYRSLRMNSPPRLWIQSSGCSRYI
jgi:TIR domain